MTRSVIGIFGGAFDPVHVGHLRTGFELLTLLQLERLHWVPTGDPRHREPAIAEAALRVRMLQAALQDESRFVLDLRELQRVGPSYTLDTLSEFRAEWPEASLCLILGMDAFLSLPQWHRWRELLTFAHLVVAHRPGWQPPEHGPLATLLDECRTLRAVDLQTTSSGKVYVHAVTALDIASRELRRIVLAGEDPRYLVPESVRRIILDSRCYAESRGAGQTRDLEG